MDDRKRYGRGRKFGIALGAIGVLMSALALQAAMAHKVTFDSSLQLKIASIDDATSQYSGRVTSTRAACEVGRPVTVTANGAVIASATTVVGGSWSATGPAQAKGTTVIATIPRKILKKNRKHRHKCAPDSAQRKAN